ncbi:MAG: acyl carrier protein [Pseudomonadota bacterium]
MKDSLERLRRVMAEEFELEPAAVVPEADLFNDLDIDSIDAIDMLARLRELTGTEISAEALRDVRTVGDVIGLLDAD